MTALDDARAALDVINDNDSYGDGGISSWALSKVEKSLEALIAEHERLTAAYSDVKSEYKEFRLDRQDQMTRIDTALADAEKGARTGNLLTPPWVIQSIADIRTEWQKVTR